MNRFHSHRMALKLCIVVLSVFLLAACHQEAGGRTSFRSIGEFSVKTLPDNCKEIRDGAGRTLVLVPRGQKPPYGYERHQIIEMPVRRVVAYSGYNVALLKALGILDKVLVGVTKKKEYWTIEEVKKGMENGRITYIGESSAVDFEKLKAIEPELVLTWDPSVISKIMELDIPGVITTTAAAMNLDTRMRFAQFLALFFNRGKEANEYVARVSRAIKLIHGLNLSPDARPKVIWGDIYEKRVLVEPGNSWVAEMVGLAGGDYLFSDIAGGS